MFFIIRSLLGTMPFLFFLYTPLIFIFYLIVPRKKNQWIFSAWEGEYYRGNSKYLFKYLKNDKEIKSVWLTKNKKLYKKMLSEGHSVVYAFSLQGFYRSLTSKLIFISHGFNDIIPILSMGATVISLSHFNYPIKKTSYEDVYNKLSLLKKIKIKFISPYNLIKPEYEIVVSKKTKESTIFLNSKDKNEKKRIKFLGHPKTDYLLSIKNKSKSILLKKFTNKITKNLLDSKIILFLPTWRKKKQFNLFGFDFNDSKINNFLIKNNLYLIINYHPFDVIKHNDPTDNRIITLSAENDQVTNLLFAADIMITDYSSVYSDYLLIDRPMIFAKFDHEDYIDERELQIDYNSLPGEIINDWNQLRNVLSNIILNNNDLFSVSRKKWREEIYDGNNDGKSCERITTFAKKLLF